MHHPFFPFCLGGGFADFPAVHLRAVDESQPLSGICPSRDTHSYMNRAGQRFRAVARPLKGCENTHVTTLRRAAALFDLLSLAWGVAAMTSRRPPSQGS